MKKIALKDEHLTNYMKFPKAKTTAIFRAVLCVLLSFMLFNSHVDFQVYAVDTYGSFGELITWRLDGDTLYISGTGATEQGILTPVKIPIEQLSVNTLDAWENGKWSEISDQVKQIVICEGITIVEKCAFCLFPLLESVTLPSTLTQIGSLAFSGCPKLYKIENIPETTLISGDAFLYDTALINAESPFLIVNDCQLIFYGETDNTDICIPEQVTSIAEYAFRGHTEISSIHIPDNVHQIGKGAFSGCSNLKKIEIPDGVKRIENAMFAGCSALEEVYLSNTITEIGESAFSDCTGLLQITIPNTVEFIDRNAFSNCSALEKVYLPEALHMIGECAFDGCTALQVMEIPSNVQSIGKNAFQNNPWILSYGDYVVLGDGILYRFQGRQKIVSLSDVVKSINKDALSGDKIVEIRIPKTVTEIQAGAIQCSRAVIAGSKGSAAEIYAVGNNMQFRDVNVAAPQGTDLTIDYEKDGWYFGNSGEVFDGEYFLTEADRQRLLDFGRDTQGVDKAWGGSCVGLALTVILMKKGVFQPSELQENAQTLSEVEPTDAVCSFINYYQCTQGFDGSTTGMSDFQKIYDMSLHLPNVKHGESPYLLCFNCAGGGSHGVAAYGLESGKWTYSEKEFDRRILVWDSNYPNALHDDSCLYYDSLTLDFCIPAYGVHVADGAGDNTAGLISARNELNVLNAYPYQFPDEISGDLNLDGSITIADAVLLCKHLTAEQQLTDSALRLADLSCNSVVNSADLTLLKKQLLLQ